jgi:hypothetical protein
VCVCVCLCVCVCVWVWVWVWVWVLSVHPTPPASLLLREEIKKHFGFAPPPPKNAMLNF